MVGRGGNSRNWLSPLFMLIHYSMAKNKEIPELFDYYCDGVSTMELAEMFNTNKSMINKIIRYKFKELWQGRK